MGHIIFLLVSAVLEHLDGSFLHRLASNSVMRFRKYFTQKVLAPVRHQESENEPGSLCLYFYSLNTIFSILQMFVKGCKHVFCLFYTMVNRQSAILYQDVDEVKGKNLVDTKAIKVKFILRINKINIKDFNVPGYL